MKRRTALNLSVAAFGFAWLGLSAPGFAAEGAPVSAPSYFPAPTPCAYYAGSFNSDVKWGTERSLGSGSAFVPLACHPDTLLFADLRFKMDGDHNREGNAGLGMRFLTGGGGIFGTYAFYDRKRSDGTGKWHTQGTVGAEWLAEHWELRANGYLPLTKKKTVTTGSPAGLAVSAPHLAGSGIYVTETLQQLLEERPMRGVDIEAGGEHPALPGLWLHAGGFSFKAHGGASLTGYRGRASYDLTENVALTAEGQWDDERGRQAWLGARFSLAFGGPSEPATGLKARMTNLPVRDVDIVTSGKVVGQPTQEQPVLNAETGETQRVLYVDNTAPDGGDGSLDRPFNTLLAAQAALRDHDVVYLAHGDGTTAGQNAGFTIDETDVLFLGEGSAFTYDGTRYVSGFGDFTGTVLKPAGDAPIITNGAGDGVTVTGDEAFLSGFTVDGAVGEDSDGIYILNVSATVENVRVLNSERMGLFNYADAAGEHSLLIRSSTFEDNKSGIVIDATGAGTSYAAISITDVVSQNSSHVGMPGYYGNSIAIFIGDGVLVDDITIRDTTASVNPYSGVLISNWSSTISSVTLSNIVANDNSWNGIKIGNGGSGQLTNISMDNMTLASNGTGLDVSAEDTSSIDNLTINSSTFNGGTQYGVEIYASDTSTINSSIESITITGNNVNGIRLDDDTTGAFVVDLGGGALGGTGGNRFYGNTGTDIWVDMDGAQLKAQNNWWGNVAGLQAARRTLNSGTIDASNFLVVDPAP